MSLIKLIELKGIGDGRGELFFLESCQNLPFDIKRVYYMIGMKTDMPRGFHAHKNLQQVAICVAGKCRLILDNGIMRESVWLDSPSKGLLIGNLLWREMHDFSEDCVLLVLASEYYDEADYIRDYKQFLKVIQNV